MGANGGKQTVVLNGTLIDGSGTEPTCNEAIVIKGNRIRSVGKLPEDVNLEDKENVQVIDAAGQWVMPGLIDCHVHLSVRQPGLPGVPWPSSAEFSTLWAARNAQKVLKAGVTSIAVPGGFWNADVAVRNAINAGLLEGPRIFCAGHFMSTVLSTSDRRNPSWRDYLEDDTGVYTPTLESIGLEVGKQAKNGVDFIKVGDTTMGDGQAWSRVELAHIVNEAHRRGVKVGIHSRGSGSTRAAAEAGVDCIFHADLATEEDLEAVAEAGAHLLPTLTFMCIAAEYGLETGMNQRMVDMTKRNVESCLRNMQIARKMGIKIVAGTDCGNSAITVHGECNMQEVEILQREVGFTPMEALVACTSGNSYWVGLEGEVGLVQEGKLADILILNGDPLADVTILQDRSRMTTLIKDGGLVDLKASTPEIELGSFERRIVGLSKGRRRDEPRFIAPLTCH
jgi:imidazolonepropionase-like amidohydrolase